MSPEKGVKKVTISHLFFLPTVSPVLKKPDRDVGFMSFHSIFSKSRELWLIFLDFNLMIRCRILTNHIAKTPAPPISETNLQNPTKPLAADLLLIDVSLVEMVRLWLSILVQLLHPARRNHIYCKQSAKEPLHAAALCEATKISKYARAYKEIDNIHFEPFVLESGGVFGERARHVCNRICNLITQSSGQSGSAIAYFWKSRPLLP